MKRLLGLSGYISVVINTLRSLTDISYWHWTHYSFYLHVLQPIRRQFLLYMFIVSYMFLNASSSCIFNNLKRPHVFNVDTSDDENIKPHFPGCFQWPSMLSFVPDMQTASQSVKRFKTLNKSRFVRDAFTDRLSLREFRCSWTVPLMLFASSSANQTHPRLFPVYVSFSLLFSSFASH